MPRRVYLRFLLGPDGPLEVAVADGQSMPLRTIALEDLQDRDSVTVFVPATDVGCHVADIPAKTEREARRAAPFSVEDEIAASIDTTHFAVSQRTEEGARLVLTCDADLMAAWMDRLDAEEITTLAVIPEFSVLPTVDCLVDIGDRYLLRINNKPMGLEKNGPADLLSALVSFAPDNLSIHGSALAKQLGRQADADVERSGIETLALLAQKNGVGTDLRQGRFDIRQRFLLPDLRKVARPVAVCAAAAMVWLVSTAWETATLTEKSRSLSSQASTLYEAAFPQEGRVTDPASRTRTKLMEGAGRTLDFESTAAVLFLSLEEVQGARLRTLRFDAPAGELSASIDYSNYGDDLRLVESLVSSGLSASVGDTRSAGAAITGDIVIKAMP